MSDPDQQQLIASVDETLKEYMFIASVDQYVREYMSHYDASHDYRHVERVLHLARHILQQEERARAQPSPPAYDETLVVLGALLHDVGDRKYLAPGEDPTTLVRDVLLARGCPGPLAARVQDLVLHVSFSAEARDPAAVRARVDGALPELAVVQDADRLDALGAVGIARCFAFGAARRGGGGGGGGGNGGGGGLEESVAHFEEKLVRLEGMMKTETGRRLARERTERIRVFRGWWESETQGLS